MNKIRVAIIDDEIEYVNDLARGLEILGYEVFKATSGAGAIDVINKNKPDIVLCDYKLEDMDGTRVITETKTANPRTIYFMVTAYYDEGLTDSFIKAGAASVIYKPIQLAEIDGIIRKAHDKNTIGR